MAQAGANITAGRRSGLTLHFARTVTSWVPYPAAVLPAGHTLKAGNTPLAPRIAHGQHHGHASVGDRVGRNVGDGVGREVLPECSSSAASARLVSIPARADALMLRKDASGLRALGLTTASLLRMAHVSLPAPRSRRAPAAQGQSQRRRGAPDRPSRRCERSLRSGMCAPALPRPTRRLFPRFAQSNQSAGRSRCALAEAPHQSRLGALLPLSLAGASSCFCRDRLRQRWGASFPFRRLGAAHHPSPALGGLRKLSLKDAKVLARFAPVARATYASAARVRAASARPKTRVCCSKLGVVPVHFCFSSRQESSNITQRS
jgi:hypothetical protein